MPAGWETASKVLDLLARRLPATAHHIALELAAYFVSDNPPAALVDRMELAFRKSGGDLREVMSAMIYSPEFWSRAAYRAKVKTPFELVVSASRALGADVDTALPLVNWVARIGEPLYQCLPPTGYSDIASAWVNAGALLNRLNFALALASNRLAGSRVQIASLLGADAQGEPLSSTRARPRSIPSRPNLPEHALDSGKAIRRSANCADEIGLHNSSQSRRHHRTRAGSSGIPATINKKGQPRGLP